jgi:hypothetical protein
MYIQSKTKVEKKAKANRAGNTYVGACTGIKYYCSNNRHNRINIITLWKQVYIPIFIGN